MIPTATQCVELAAERLSNSSFDEPFTQARLLTYFNQAYRELFGKLQGHGVPAAKRIRYFNLPAYTNILSPAKAGITDFGQLVPQGLSERPIVSTHTVTFAEASSGEIKLTLSGAHGLSANTRAVAYGVTADDGANGDWFISVPSSTTVTLNGSTASVGGTPVASTGVLSVGSERFIPLHQQELPGYDEAQALTYESLRIFEWSGEVFRFIGATAARQLRLEYRRSAADLTLTESTGIDNSKNFLGLRAAELAAKDYDRQSHAKSLQAEADAALLDLVNFTSKVRQANVIRRPPFRHTMGNRVHTL